MEIGKTSSLKRQEAISPVEPVASTDNNPRRKPAKDTVSQGMHRNRDIAADPSKGTNIDLVSDPTKLIEPATGTNVDKRS
ncbi:MAG: hypothetical protein WD992_01410 [Candidatus Levyibacteriota bacterium]